jgi:hypothetical protein
LTTKLSRFAAQNAAQRSMNQSDGSKNLAILVLDAVCRLRQRGSGGRLKTQKNCFRTSLKPLRGVTNSPDSALSHGKSFSMPKERPNSLVNVSEQHHFSMEPFIE